MLCSTYKLIYLSVGCSQLWFAVMFRLLFQFWTLQILMLLSLIPIRHIILLSQMCCCFDGLDAIILDVVLVLLCLAAMLLLYWVCWFMYFILGLLTFGSKVLLHIIYSKWAIFNLFFMLLPYCVASTQLPKIFGSALIYLYCNIQLSSPHDICFHINISHAPPVYHAKVLQCFNYMSATSVL